MKDIRDVDGDLITIGRKDQRRKNRGDISINRRTFLKGVGGLTALGIAGCGKSSAKNILPFVKGDRRKITGSPVYFKTTCSECQAGCGIVVKVVDGRAVKIEGNPQHPVNRGGVCAIGHSALQALYDPDRIREPLMREDGRFKPISWQKALDVLRERISSAKNSAYMGSNYTGALRDLLDNFLKQFSIKNVRYNTSAYHNTVDANDISYGIRGIPKIDISKCDLVLSFGADFLETWVSPCEFARGYAESRRRKKPCRYIHIEPRLSLTAANCDVWLNANPGSEVLIGLFLIKYLLERGFGTSLSKRERKNLEDIVSEVSIENVSQRSSIDKAKIITTAFHLANAQTPVVIVGGTLAEGEDNTLSLIGNLINILVDAPNKVMDFGHIRSVEVADRDAINELVQQMNGGNVDLLLFDDSNPLYHLPASLALKYALKKVGFKVSFSSFMDETTAMADLILPTNHALEDWGVNDAVEGVYSMSQPVMKRVFNTKSLGDILLQIAGKKEEFRDFVRRWIADKSAHGRNLRSDGEWIKVVENGGIFDARAGKRRIAPRVSAILKKLNKLHLPLSAEHSNDAVGLYVFRSVKAFDGRTANRAWLQELPEPMSQISWDTWAEIHPDTARKYGLAKEDVITIRNYDWELNLGVRVTPYVNRGIVAVPIGGGHTEYGRFARGFGENPLYLVKYDDGYLTKVSIKRGIGIGELTEVQGSDSQHNRGIGKTRFIGAHEHGAHESHEHKPPKQMYLQREHPLYKWGMTVDLASCTGCSACVTACYSENNIPVVGRKVVRQGREMSWLRIERYYDDDEGTVSLVPMMCQHCDNAPCEPVCPVYATYHNEEGLNVMVYNRCVGTRYCSNNCSYKVRRFNWLQVDFPEPLNWQLNPDVTPRSAGVMEKCTFCIQRIVEAKDRAKDQGRRVKDGEVQPACVQSCPTKALTFGDLNDPDSKVSRNKKDSRAYKILDHHLNTQPSVVYLEDIKYKDV